MLTYLIGGISRALQQGNSTRNRVLFGSDVVVERYYLKPNNFLDLQFRLCIKNLLTYFLMLITYAQINWIRADEQ